MCVPKGVCGLKSHHITTDCSTSFLFIAWGHFLVCPNCNGFHWNGSREQMVCANPDCESPHFGLKQHYIGIRNPLWGRCPNCGHSHCMMGARICRECGEINYSDPTLYILVGRPK